MDETKLIRIQVGYGQAGQEIDGDTLRLPYLIPIWLVWKGPIYRRADVLLAYPLTKENWMGLN